MSALEQSPLQHLYFPVFGATLKLRPPHTGQVYLFFPLAGSSLSKWSRMSNEFALDLSESSVKSDAKLPLVGYDVVMIRRSPHGECEAINRCVQVPIEAAVFGVYSCWKIWMLKKKISIAIGTAFSRQRKNIEAKSQFSCE
jgi:hypothetical protein